MEKRIVSISYWLGLLCVVLALLARLLNVLGVSFSSISTRGNEISFRTFLDGALLFFLTTIATTSYSWFKATINEPEKFPKV